MIKVTQAIEQFMLIPRDSAVIAAVSGGADSVTLLDVLFSLKDKLGFSLVVAHVNHGIRGAEAQRDEDFVSELSKKYSLPFEVKHVDCPAESKRTGEGLEECGRRMRYEFFSELSAKYNGALTATAHNADDNAETVLFNITRGASLSGLCGIPVKRDGIIRPLLFCSRSEIEEYCKEKSLSYVTDSTNTDTAYSRNRIRAEVIPALKAINPSFVSAVTRMCALNQRDEEYLVSLAQSVPCECDGFSVSFDAQSVRELPLSVRSRLYKRCFGLLELSPPRGAEQLAGIDSVLLSGGKLQLTGELFAELKNEKLRLFKPQISDEDKPAERLLPDCDGVYYFGKYKITLTKHNYSEKINFSMWENAVDCDTINGSMFLRSRRAGDEITLAKRKVTKSLKKLFCENEVPEDERELIPVISDGEKVLWVYGAGVNRPCSLTDKTKIYYTIQGERIC